MSFYMLSKTSGIPLSTLKRMATDAANPTQETLARIAGCFNMNLREFYDSPVFDHVDWRKMQAKPSTKR